jgi:uncharacterized protein (TIGR03067 family)
MKTRLLALLAVFLLLAADDPKEDAVKEEMKKLEGTWRTVSTVSNGKAWPEDKHKAITLTLKADGTWIMKDDKESWDGTFTVDPSKKPKTGNYVGLNGKFKGSTTLDIYELDGDTLKFCYVVVPTGKESTKERPSKFASEEGSGHILSVMKREKSK